MKKVLAGLSMSALILSQGAVTFAFSDVPSNAWYATQVADFVAEGLLDSGQARFRGGDPALRAEFIKLVVELNGGVMGTAPSTASFADVAPGAWYFDYIEDAAAEGWVRGDGNCYVNGTTPCFARPGALINRAEAAALINRSFILVGTGEAPQFVDNPTGQWYTQDIQVAADNCVLKGDGGTKTVRPGDNMNRAEMVVMLHRANQGLQYPECGDEGGGDVVLPPGIDNVTPIEVNKIEVEFTVDVDQTEAEMVANYEVDGLTVTSASRTSPDLVELTFDTGMSAGESYTLFVHGVTVGGEEFDDSASFLGYRDTIPSSGELEVSLNPNTPIGDTVPRGSIGVAMISVDFTANCEDDILVDGLTVIHEGQGVQSDITNAWMSVNGARVSRTRIFDSQDQTADLRFSRPLLIQACDTVTVDFMADFVSTASVNGRHNYVVELASDIDSNARAVSGNFPIRGETFETAAVSTGIVTVTYRTVTPSNVDVNDQDALIGKFEFAVNSTEDQTFYSVTVENTGTASDGDFTDMFLRRTDQTALTDTVSQTVADYATLTFDPPFTVLEGDKVTLEVVADIMDGAADTVKLHFEEANDVFAVGSLYGYGVNGQLYGSQISLPTETSTLPAAVTINAGELTIDIDGPTTEQYTPDASDVVMANIDFVTGGEDVNVNEMYALIVGKTSTGGTLSCGGTGTSYVGDQISEVLEDVQIRNTVTGQTVDGVKVYEPTTPTCSATATTNSSTAIYRFDDFVLRGSSRWELQVDMKENGATVHPKDGDKFQAFICTADEADTTGCDFGGYISTAGGAAVAYNLDAEGLSTGDVLSDIRPGEDLQGNWQEIAVASLTVTEIQLGARDNVVQKAVDVTMMRFQASAGRAEDVFITQVVLKADTGSLVDATQYTLWVDNDNNGTVDNILQTGKSCEGTCSGATGASDQVVFDKLVGGGYTVPANKPVTFEVHANISGSVRHLELSIGFDDADGATDSVFNFIDAVEADNGTSLSCISVNGDNSGTGTAGSGECSTVSAPQIVVTNTTSKIFDIKNSGSLFVRASNMPSTRQLLAGELGESIMRLEFTAENEPISIQRLVFTNSGATAVKGIRQLELYKEGVATPIGYANAVKCNAIFPASNSTVRDQSFCVSMDADEFIVGTGDRVYLDVRPSMMDDYTAVQSNTGAIRLVLNKIGDAGLPGSELTESSTGSIIATGFDSQNPLLVPTFDGSKVGELYIGVGTDVTGGAEVAITGSRNDVVLARIVAIEDVNPDNDGAAVSNGATYNKPIAQYKFTAADNVNGKTGNNTATLSGIIFTVASSNVSFDSTKFQLSKLGTTDDDDKITCTATGSLVGTVHASGAFHVICDLTGVTNTTKLDGMQIKSGQSTTLVLEADIADGWIVETSVSSSFMVSLNNFNARPIAAGGTTRTGYPAEGDAVTANSSHIRWTDSFQETGQTFFEWIEYGQQQLDSTRYGS